MRLSLAGGVTVVLVFAILMLQPGGPRLGHGLRSGLNPPGAQLQDQSRVLTVMQLC